MTSGSGAGRDILCQHGRLIYSQINVKCINQTTNSSPTVRAGGLKHEASFPTVALSKLAKCPGGEWVTMLCLRKITTVGPLSVHFLVSYTWLYAIFMRGCVVSSTVRGSHWRTAAIKLRVLVLNVTSHLSLEPNSAPPFYPSHWRHLLQHTDIVSTHKIHHTAAHM